MREELSGDGPNDRPFTSRIPEWLYIGEDVGAMRAYGSTWEPRGIDQREAGCYDRKTKDIRIALYSKHQVDWTRRLLGLWILFTNSWFLAWGAYTMSTCSLENVRVGSPGPLSTMCRVDFSDWSTQYHYFTVWDYATLVGSGITILIGILALGLSIFLVSRSVRSNLR